MSLFGYFPEKRVENTQELQRIAALPRRQWTEASAAELAALLTPLLRTPGGTQELRPVQGQALHDAGTRGGLFAAIRVGGGKTLISLLAAYILGLQRPLLLVPAALVEKTKREARILAAHWRIPYERIRVVSYESLGRVNQALLLVNHRPDGILCDEVHRLKNAKAAVTKRVSRYMAENPSTKFVAMSGTVTKRSLKDFAHILRWIFGQDTPLPRGYAELEKWCSALDEKTNPMALVLHPGALLDVLADPSDEGEDDTATARKAFRRRLAETPGVVATTEGHTGCSLYVDTWVLPRSGAGEPTIEGAFQNLRDNALTPDGFLLPDGISQWACARQLALGFYYKQVDVHGNRPPEPWVIARQAWNKKVREWIKYVGREGMHLDSELQVRQALANGMIPDEDDCLRIWKEIEPTFVATTVPVWLDDGAADAAVQWLQGHPKGICWVEHTAFGERVAWKSGLPYFHRKGMDGRGLVIDDPATPFGPCIASIASNGTGRNLQAWNANLITSCPANGAQMEQLLGRCHREGQEADEVSATILLACIEHLEAIEQGLLDARYIEDSTGQAQKLLYCDLTIPLRGDISRIPSRRFQR